MSEERCNVQIGVFDKEVFGSIVGGEYSDDTLYQVRDWLEALIKRVPEEYRANAQIKVDSVGGYEGEHHAEIEVYYTRPETDKEMAARIAEREHRRQQEIANAERRLQMLRGQK